MAGEHLGEKWFVRITVFDLITAHAPISAQ